MKDAPRLTPLMKVAMALVVATLLYGRQVASWTTPRNRFLYHWQLTDGLGLVVGLLGLGLLFLATGLLACGSAWVRRQHLHEFAFLFLFVLGVLAQFQGLAGLHAWWAGVVLWGGVAVAIHQAWRRWSTSLVLRSAQFCVLLSPLVPILVAQVLSWPAVDRREAGAARAVPMREEAAPIVVIVFDEWSWPRSTERGQVRSSLLNLAALADRALVVQNALSPSDTTRLSLPRLLLQREGELRVRSRSLEWIEDGARTPAREVPSLLDMARGHGYRSVLLGYYLPYRELVGDEGDLVRSYVQYPKGRGLPGAVGHGLIRNVQYWSDPISQALWEPLYNRLYSEHWREVNQRLPADLSAELLRLRGGTFVFSHQPMPHGPFVFNRDGSYRGPFKGRREEGTPEQYEEHLHFADQVLGQFVLALERSGQFDRALLVVTSDHSWRHDPDPRISDAPLARQRVPLLVKWPGQRTGLVVEGPFCTTRLAPLFEAVMAQGGAPPLTAELWRELSAEGRSGAACRP